MGIVSHILDYKGSDVYKISMEATVFSALEELARHDIGALIVLDAEENIVGIFSERDYARKVVLQGKSSKNTKVKDMMTTNVYFVSPDEYLRTCLEIMTKKRTRHLPVVKDKKLVGLVSIGDIVNRIIHEQKTKIKDLEGYILGSGYGSNIKIHA